ncbi:hypothetical protein PN36_28695 [Candidatus Thiomargarita nelsonii]|uniref:Uncharacterized protein n=1 Tax=Candidatus Thiomargarita nelsonii TaxID=1003181 RepID=A0A0A6PJ75_9GAMM|nr:hypothetical protein PN36_28695 [Candidatus Thiomargarita nelsonii]
MNILHGTWIPKADDDFIQNGKFYLWVESSYPSKKTKTSKGIHPNHLNQKDLLSFIGSLLGLSSGDIAIQYFLLPTAKNQPLPSPELSRYLEVEIPKTITLQSWKINCYALSNIIKTLNDIHFLKIANSLVYDCVYRETKSSVGDSALAEYKLWHSWQQKLLTANATFYLGFQLQEAKNSY